MTLRAEYSLGHSEFNEFLFAIVGEEKNGLQLTVLSALARLGLDPWGEAARLSELPREAATRAIATEIAKLPEGNWKASDSETIATRLVACLPRPGVALRQSRLAEKNAKLGAWPAASKWLVWLVFLAAAIFAISQLN